MAKRKTLTVKVKITFDPDAYNAEYGSRDEIDDIKVQLAHRVVEAAQSTLDYLKPAVTVDGYVGWIGK